MGQSAGKRRSAGITIPAIGDRVERRRAGDQLQILVKWDDGSSSSLRVDRDAFRNLGPAEKSDPPTARKARE